jgi:hypothetical protein
MVLFSIGGEICEFPIHLYAQALFLNLPLHSVWQNTADAQGIPFKPLPESGFIGPT